MIVKSYEDALARLPEEIERLATRLEPIYAALNWTWWHTQGKPPTAQDIKDTFVKLAREMQEYKAGAISTGGLFIRMCDEDGNVKSLIIGMKIESDLCWEEKTEEA